MLRVNQAFEVGASCGAGEAAAAVELAINDSETTADAINLPMAMLLRDG